MCGIAGILALGRSRASVELEAMRRIRDAMSSRGPDGVGEWLSPGGELALGHRRLAILDLSPGGAQPMADPSGRYRIVFNGEIYNFRELRAALERDGLDFGTGSDTEVLLALWHRERERCLPRLRGMYAFAIWDDAERTLTLARDPFGIKPLYYQHGGGGELRFASQVRALEAGGAALEIDPAGLAGFLLWGSVPEPWTIRSAIRCLPAGHLLTVRDGDVGEPRRSPTLQPVDEPVLPGDGFVAAISASVEAHLVSDVPVAAFLSAGIDSGIVAALAARRLGERLTTFTLTFEGWAGSDRDEAPAARDVARRIGSTHVERLVTRADVAAAWRPALAAMDQPSVDGFNTFLVARAAHEAGIKVALSGLGGDELFGSYPSFRDVPRWARRSRRLAAVPGADRLWRAAARPFRAARPKLAGLLRHGGSLAGAYFLRRGLFLPEELPRLLGRERAAAGLAALEPVAFAKRALDLPDPAAPPGGGSDDAWKSVQKLESAIYLRHQLLRDSDWAAMASSVELRVPFVDPTLRAQLARLGDEPARSQGKRAVARAVVPELPAEHWDRPKSGFAVPVADWICPAAPGESARAGSGSRRMALRVLEEWGVPCRGAAR